jgi:hypothetical protein
MLWIYCFQLLIASLKTTNKLKRNISPTDRFNTNYDTHSVSACKSQYSLTIKLWYEFCQPGSQPAITFNAHTHGHELEPFQFAVSFPALFYRAYNLKRNPTTITYYGTKTESEAGPLSFNTLPTCPLTLESRSPFLPGRCSRQLRKSCGNEHGETTGRMCVHSWTLLRIEIVCCCS